MLRVILDTNFLLVPGQSMIDVFSGIEAAMTEPFVLVVLDKTLAELEKLADGNSKDARAAKLGLALVMAKKAENPTLWEKLLGLKRPECRKVQVAPAGRGYVDDAILRLADKETIVATLDGALRKKLAGRGVRTLTIQGRRVKLA